MKNQPLIKRASYQDYFISMSLYLHVYMFIKETAKIFNNMKDNWVYKATLGYDNYQANIITPGYCLFNEKGQLLAAIHLSANYINFFVKANIAKAFLSFRHHNKMKYRRYYDEQAKIEGILLNDDSIPCFIKLKVPGLDIKDSLKQYKIKEITEAVMSNIENFIQLDQYRHAFYYNMKDIIQIDSALSYIIDYTRMITE